DLDAEWAGTGGLTLGVAAVTLPREGIGGGHAGEGEQILRIEVILAITLGAAGLREAIVHTNAAARGNPLHVAVEHLSAGAPVIVLVEAEMAEVIEHAAGLRGDLRIDSRDVIRQRIRLRGVVLRLVAQP